MHVDCKIRNRIISSVRCFFEKKFVANDAFGEVSNVIVTNLFYLVFLEPCIKSPIFIQV